jgi:alpha-N-arabinofuranosidase
LVRPEIILSPAARGASLCKSITREQAWARGQPEAVWLMTEEINFSYDGGLYAELVRNRSFKEDAKEPVHWRLV